jgi:hypothetical protein
MSPSSTINERRVRNTLAETLQSSLTRMSGCTLRDTERGDDLQRVADRIVDENGGAARANGLGDLVQDGRGGLLEATPCARESRSSCTGD